MGIMESRNPEIPNTGKVMVCGPASTPTTWATGRALHTLPQPCVPSKGAYSPTTGVCRVRTTPYPRIGGKDGYMMIYRIPRISGYLGLWDPGIPGSRGLGSGDPHILACGDAQEHITAHHYTVRPLPRGRTVPTYVLHSTLQSIRSPSTRSLADRRW